MENPDGGGAPNSEPEQRIDMQLLRSKPNQLNRPKQIHRVLPQLRLRRPPDDRTYDPMMVSLGPYHHGDPQLHRSQEFKYICLDWCTECNDNKKLLLYQMILNKIDEIRSCYADVSIVKKYDDATLALMMLLDASFIVDYIHIYTGAENSNLKQWCNCLGQASVSALAFCDILLLENQIPFCIIEFFLSFRREKQEEANKLLDEFLSKPILGSQNEAKICREKAKEPPTHMLEAYWRTMVGIKNGQQHNMGFEEAAYSSLSVVDLKAKGIHCAASSSRYLKGIVLKSQAHYAILELPVRYVSERTGVVLSNMIAFELSPNELSEYVVVSYVNFMKSLIQSPADVKELQRTGVVFNRLASHEKVVKMFEEIDTFGIVTNDSFRGVKQRIEEHCGSKTKTWIADLIHTWFKSPWSAVALFAATSLLCLTFLQTFYTINPK